MKFRIHLSPNDEGIPFNYNHQLCGIFHSWLGDNELHDLLSLYSIGGLFHPNSQAKNGSLHFPRGAWWDIGIYHTEIAEKLIGGVLIKSFHFYGMNLRSVERLEEPIPETTNKQKRYLASTPVFVRKEEADGNRKFLYFNDPESTISLTKTFKRKVSEAGLMDYWIDNTHVRFDQDYPRAKTKMITFKGYKARANQCPVYVNAEPKLQTFLWEVGAGDLTGMGFGSLNE